jgi:hypothetical protein
MTLSRAFLDAGLVARDDTGTKTEQNENDTATVPESLCLGLELCRWSQALDRKLLYSTVQYLVSPMLVLGQDGTTRPISALSCGGCNRCLLLGTRIGVRVMLAGRRRAAGRAVHAVGG